MWDARGMHPVFAAPACLFNLTSIMFIYKTCLCIQRRSDRLSLLGPGVPKHFIEVPRLVHVRHDVAPPHELAIDITSIAEGGRRGEMKPIHKFTLEPRRGQTRGQTILVATHVQEWCEGE